MVVSELQQSRQLEIDFSIIEPRMTIEAMRASGYKSTTHALAELIDNSIESGADIIEVFGVSRYIGNEVRSTLQLQELAILDNGSGMHSHTLRSSLRYGFGTRASRQGIGRYGMGLPNSSMSQARCLDVWSWQTGITNAMHTRLHLDDIEQGATEIPEPELSPVPAVYLNASQYGFRDSGTLVVWRDLDRVEWRRASTTFKHTEFLLGRIYRRFLARETERLHQTDVRASEIGDRRSIYLIPVTEYEEEFEVDENEIIEVRPNDPLYLMSGTSCPEDYGEGRMFAELENISPFNVPIEFNDDTFNVQLRASYARPLSRNSTVSDADWPEKWVGGSDAGSTPWGKHAGQNLGISLMRAHREILLDDTWTSASDPTDRWWKIEIDFPPQLDELFGVSYTKQGAATFPRLAVFDWRREALEGETRHDVIKRMKETGDHRSELINVFEQIIRTRTVLRKRVESAKMARGPRHQDTTEEEKADDQVSNKIKERIEHGGHKGASDKKAEKGTEEDHKKEQLDSLVNRHHIDPKTARNIVDEAIETDKRVRWLISELSSPAFFDVEPYPNVLQVVLNSRHPIHTQLWEVLHPNKLSEEMSVESLREALDQTTKAFKILIYAWARYEEEQTDRVRSTVQFSRIEWGKYAQDFFEIDDDSFNPTNLV